VTAAPLCVTAFTVSVYLVWFHRLVGRIGWIISQVDSAEDDDAVEEEDMGEHEIFAN